MRIKNLRLKNFKKIDKMELNFECKNVKINGENATGKTTIYDAYLWLLFDKDSTDRKDFEIKTLTETGDPIHNLEHEVEIVLVHNNKETKLRKLLQEKWTRKRGSETEEFTGHETSYWVDDVPVKKKEYTEIISGLIQENVFKLLSSPHYFNESLDWKERRKMLFDSFVKNEIDIFSLDSSLNDIKEDIETLGIDNLKKRTADRKKLLNDNVKAIPIRIDEALKSKPDLREYDEAVTARVLKVNVKTEIESEIKKMEEEKKNIDKTLLEIRNKTVKLENLKIEIENKANRNLKIAELSVKTYKQDIQDKKEYIEKLEQAMKQQEDKVNHLQESREKLLKDWNKAKDEIYVYIDLDCTCPTCKQQLPTEMIENKEKIAKDNFEENKKLKLQLINETGAEIAENIKKAREIINKNADDIIKIEEEIKETENLIKAAEEIIKNGLQIIINYDDNFEYTTLKKELESMQTASFDDSDLLELKSRLEFVNDEITGIDETIKLKKRSEEIEERVKQLQAEQKTFVSELLKLEKIEFLIEKYLKLKAESVQDSINKNFKIVNWKLFETQINGGINEICVATVNGVSYADLNTACKIQAGMDIIQAFSKVYEIDVPIFIDNAESIIDIPTTESQQIKLYVAEGEKELKITAGD